MSMRTKSLCLGICLLARATFGMDPIASFARQSLSFDLASVPFGTKAHTNGAYIKAGPPLPEHDLVDAPGVSWITNAVSVKYSRDFPNRALRYGVRDGRLAAVEIYINSLLSGDESVINWDKIERQRKELIQIQKELIRAKHSRDNSNFRIEYGAMCAPSPESLFLMEIQITPVEKTGAP